MWNVNLFTKYIFSYCATHFIALYRGSTPDSDRLATVCGQDKTVMIFPGPNLLLEFNSGQQVPPFLYNGFSANLEFVEGPPTTTIVAVEEEAPMEPPFEFTTSPQRFSPCDQIINEANGRSGHFDTRGRTYAGSCRLIFKGKPTDVVHVSIFNYRLKYVYNAVQ